MRGPLTGHRLSTPAACRSPAGGGAALGPEEPCLSLLWGVHSGGWRGFPAGPGPQGRGAAEAGRRLGSADPAGLSVSAAQVHRHLDQHEVRYLQFAFRWMNNLLMRELPLHCTVRLWDTYQVRPQGVSPRAGH